MAGVSSFDQWRKDVFFSAAEEVQGSTDALESVYRMWVRCRSDGVEPHILDELLRELRIALGTAKWQLEEFERAVRSTHGNYMVEDTTITRHREFVSTLGNQISFIEKVLGDSFVEEGKQPLRWVQLNEEERDDLALFLSAAPQVSHRAKDKYDGSDLDELGVAATPNPVRCFKEIVTINKDSKYIVEVAANELSSSKVGVVAQEQLDGQGTSSSSDIGSWKIVIADDNDENRKLVEARSRTPSHSSSLHRLLRSVESALKLKLLKGSSRKAKSEEHFPLNHGLSRYLETKETTHFSQGTNGLNERSRNCFSNYNEDSKVSTDQHLAGRVSGFQRHSQGLQYSMWFGRSLRISIVLLLAIILIVPFALYST